MRGKGEGPKSALDDVDIDVLSLSLSLSLSHKDRINIRILQNSILVTPIYWALEPECKILMFMWSFPHKHKDLTFCLKGPIHGGCQNTVL